MTRIHFQKNKQIHWFNKDSEISTSSHENMDVFYKIILNFRNESATFCCKNKQRNNICYVQPKKKEDNNYEYNTNKDSKKVYYFMLSLNIRKVISE